jgi:elongation factor G
VHGIDPKSGGDEERPADPKAPFSALAFKVMSDPYVGKLTYFRLLRRSRRRSCVNITGRERIGRILQMPRTTGRSGRRSWPARSRRASA